MTDTFPRQNARTKGFTLGVPRSFQISPDGSRVVFLRSKGGSDPVTCLWQLDVASGQEQLVADPARLGADGDLDEAEKARRERAREQADGIVAFGCDADVRLAVFGLSGRVYAASLTGTAPGSDPDAGPGAGTTRIPALPPARPARTGSSPPRTGRATSRSGSPSSSPPRRCGEAAATGGRRTPARCSSRGSTRAR
jgi:hypothetical protein